MRKLAENAALTLVLGALCVAALVAFNRLAAPERAVLPPAGVVAPDYAAVVVGVTEAKLREDLEALCAAESRFSGTAGCERVADHIAGAFRKLGYQVVEQPFALTVPATRHARIVDASGREMDGIRIHPLLPNWFRTATTPPEGLRGKVFRAERGLAREFKGVSLKGNFALLPLGTAWSTVAGMGARAVLYFDDGKKSVGPVWPHHATASVNVPRFLVTGDPARLAGREVTISARVDLGERPARNIVGILDVPGCEGEALVAHAYYDAYSYVPDMAPGAQQACGPAVLLALARHLAGEAKELKRSVVLVATAGHGQGLFGIREFLGVLGTREDRSGALAAAVAAAQESARAVPLAEAAAVVAEDPACWAALAGGGGTDYWAARPEGLREYVAELVAAVVDDDLMAALEAAVQARVAWVRDGLAVRDADGNEAQSFQEFQRARRRQQVMQAVVATPLDGLKDQWAGYLREQRVAARVAELARRRLATLTRRREEAASIARLAEALARYTRVLFLGLDLTAASGRVGLVCGEPGMVSACMPADSELAAQFRRAGEKLQETDATTGYVETKRGEPRFVNLLRGEDSRDLGFISEWYGAPWYFESLAAAWGGHTAFTLATLDDGRGTVGTPGDTLDAILEPSEKGDAGKATPLADLCTVARLVTAAASQLARGHGRFVPLSRGSEVYTIRGEVVSQIGENLTPDHPMPGAVVRFGPALLWGNPVPMLPGVGGDMAVTADEHGRFELRMAWPSALSFGWGAPVDIDAGVLRPEDGEVTWTLSTPKSGPQGAYPVRGVKLAQYRKSLASAVVFRAAPVHVAPMAEPATLRPYAGFDFIETKSMAAPQEFKLESSQGAYVCFVPPDSRLYFTFKKGKQSNPNLMEIRAFALGASGPADGSAAEDEGEIQGEGYFAADTPTITNIELDAALSMAQVNARRTRLQERYGMTDEMVRAYNQRATELADQACKLAAQGRTVMAKRAASESLAYSSNIHLVIRKNASDAVVGILFYLFLAIPFALFLEKLLIGHPDLRYQIAFQALIFILFFLALRAVHPAYELVRSSYMILLGFITFALAAMVTAFLAGRFSKNIAELNRRFQERAEAADVSRAGAAATAFLLGLSNLRKRPVRTGLTVGTLILTTFVMLCFASVSTDVVDVEFPLGKAPYSGLLVRDRNLRDVGAALAPLRELYGEDHVVAQRDWAGTFSVTQGQTPELAEFTVVHAVGDKSFECRANAILGLSQLEPRVTPIEATLEVAHRWFTSDAEEACFLPRAMADVLRLSDEQVKAGKTSVKIAGRQYTVLGIFDDRRLDTVLDLDGEPLLPVDVLSLRDPVQAAGGVGYTEEATEIPENVPRLPSRQVVITAVEAMPSRTLTASIGVALKELDYRSARGVILAHLERSAEPTYYGLDGVAFYGGRFRMQSLEGILDLLLPIVIASLTVLNTMRGSVYERRTELYVFNAVGLSPNHIRSLFLAEACVYAVVGAVGGYLLAQGTGAALKALDLTAGLTMNYSSMASVLVSVVIIVAVLLSSLYPARMAARLAAPAEVMTRERSTAAGDALELDLPFTFSRRDRVAIVPYFVDWFENYGEGSSGEYFCTPPECGIRAEEGGAASPFVQTTTWLKPYDLGVSQTVALVVRRLPETGDNVATVIMTRKSGDRESWERCCHAFIGLLRKRFLTWRAISDPERSRLLERGRRLLEATLGPSWKRLGSQP